MGPTRALHDNGKATVRFYLNRVAVRRGLLEPHDPHRPGWRITDEGRAWVASQIEAHGSEVTSEGLVMATERVPPAWRQFERWCLALLERMYPDSVWALQQAERGRQRGLDLVGTCFTAERFGRVTAVQVKLHDADRCPSDEEWSQFLAGCPLRRSDRMIFITTGRVSAVQQREAQDAGIVVMAGEDTLKRVASLYGLAPFGEPGADDDERPAPPPALPGRSDAN
jgi:hypothetical protein